MSNVEIETLKEQDMLWYKYLSAVVVGC